MILDEKLTYDDHINCICSNQLKTRDFEEGQGLSRPGDICSVVQEPLCHILITGELYTAALVLQTCTTYKYCKIVRAGARCWKTDTHLPNICTKN